jgi:hypothetical protein
MVDTDTKRAIDATELEQLQLVAVELALAIERELFGIGNPRADMNLHNRSVSEICDDIAHLYSGLRR